MKNIPALLKFSAFQKDRRLGVSEGRRRYDLPLSDGAGTGFMILLIGLMTFLAMMSIAAGFALDGMSSRWTSGLENTLTIEIPAALPSGKLRGEPEIREIERVISRTLKKNDNIESLDVLEEKQIAELLSPWLEGDNLLEDVPLPGLVSVRLRSSEEKEMDALKTALGDIAPDIRIDAHESWLGDILRLARSLKFSTALVTLVVMITTITAVAGAIRSRMAEHKDDIELLHMMGASDIYVMRQFRRHAVILALRGALAGVAGGGLALLAVAMLNRGAGENLLPDFSLSPLQILILLALPVAVCLIASETSRFTVLRVLSRMP